MLKRIVLFIALLSVLSVAVYSEPIELKCKFKPNQILKYQCKINMYQRMPMMGNLPTSENVTDMSLLYTIQVFSVFPDGSAKVKFIISDPVIVATANGEALDVPAIKMPSRIVQLSPTFSIMKVFNSKESAKDTEMMNNLTASNSGFYGLPKSPVNLGETWEETNFIPSLGQKFITKSTLLEVKANGDDNIAKVQTLYNTDTAELTFSGTSTYDFSTVYGQLLSSVSAMNIKMKMKTPIALQDQGGPDSITIDMKMNMTMTKI